MSFDVGDKVVYPHHGAATIEKREKKDVFGEKRDYLVLRLAYGDLTLMVPADNAEEIGLRDVINDEEVEEVFAVLRKKEARMPTNWSRRFKNHVEKLKCGDIYQVAEVVRNLSIREKDKGLSAGEKRMLAQGAPDPRLGADLRHRTSTRKRPRSASTRCSRLDVPATQKPPRSAPPPRSSHGRAGVWAIVVAAGRRSLRRAQAVPSSPARGRRPVGAALTPVLRRRRARRAARARLGRRPVADAVVAGGDTGRTRCAAGLDAVPEDADVVVVHDAARPLASARCSTR